MLGELWPVRRNGAFGPCPRTRRAKAGGEPSSPGTRFWSVDDVESRTIVVPWRELKALLRDPRQDGEHALPPVPKDPSGYREGGGSSIWASIDPI